MSVVYVYRCSKCDGASHEPGALLWDCRRCGGKECYGLVDSSIAPALVSEQAINAPILSGRFYENTRATDGTDIGSRKKHREYMKANGLTIASDYTQTWQQKAEQREQVARGERGALPSKTRREVLARKLYQLDKP